MPGGSSEFQSTLPHGERRKDNISHLQTRIISIHAPARGATADSQHSFTGRLFQSTLPHGERLQIPRPSTFCNYFNPRSRTGSDTKADTAQAEADNFNPRSRTGSD